MVVLIVGGGYWNPSARYLPLPADYELFNAWTLRLQMKV